MGIKQCKIRISICIHILRTHGYLCDSGVVIRSLNSNNSYGEYGSTSTGIDANETPYTGTVDLRNNEATVGRVLVSGSGIGRLELEFAWGSFTLLLQSQLQVLVFWRMLLQI